MKNTSFNLRILITLATATFISITSTSSAAPISHSSTPGAGATTTGLATFSTAGDDMVGMTVCFEDTTGAVDCAPWVPTGTEMGEAVGANFTLSESGLTGSGGVWTLTRTGSVDLRRVFLNGATGNTLFDRSFGGVEGTPGSSTGSDLFETASTSFAVDVNYSQEVNVIPNPAVGDLFAYMTIGFTDPAGFTGSTFTFGQDTDNSDPEGSLHVNPEPSSLVLMGMGAVALIGYRWRRKRLSRD